MRVLSVGHLRQRLLAFFAAGLGGLLAAGLSFAMALYGAAHPPAVVERKAGEAIDTGRWQIALRGATIGTLPPTGIKPFTPRPLVMITFDARNLSAEPSSLLAPVFEIAPETPGLKRPVFYLARDAYLAGALNPDMAERVIGVWEWPDGVIVPETLTVTLKGQTYKKRDNLYGASGWFEGDAVARVTLPLTRGGS